ncbi:MAG: TlyA family rRNA (cytidine-2'-O)-methyltransferase [Planctomycetes bacterium]|nr:TlyA family rRNA (cytidine-2'-O)-methyltransferase [Planctomycetota bacterium]NOG53904.1 TlyA family rRNA (cytidine-2'-O)-methyltransferase [Planctomycetota bacterium]
MPQDSPADSYVGVAGHKLRHALTAFGLSARQRICADFGCHIGGFTDCLLQDGADRVYAVDTGYGILDYRLRMDARVHVMERTNVLHADPPEDAGGVSLVAIDVGWTPQARVLPVACRWVVGSTDPVIISLIKPHYELSAMEESARCEVLGSDEVNLEGTDPGVGRRGRKGSRAKRRTVIPDAVARRILDHLGRVVFPTVGVEVLDSTQSPIRGGSSRSHKPGNIEFLALLRPVKQ